MVVGLTETQQYFCITDDWEWLRNNRSTILTMPRVIWVDILEWYVTTDTVVVRIVTCCVLTSLRVINRVLESLVVITSIGGRVHLPDTTREADACIEAC